MSCQGYGGTHAPTPAFRPRESRRGCVWKRLDEQLWRGIENPSLLPSLAAHRVAALTRLCNLQNVTQRTQRVTSLLISRSHSTELAIAVQNTQSCGLKLTVPNAR